MQEPGAPFGRWLGMAKKTPKWVWGLAILATILVIALLVNPGQEPRPSSSIVTDPTLNSASLAIEVFLKFGLILGFIYLGFYALKRWQIRRPGRANKQVSILETHYLNPRRTIHLLQVGDRTILIGATDQSITLLTEIEPQPGEEEHKANFTTGEFAGLLDANLSAK